MQTQIQVIAELQKKVEDLEKQVKDLVLVVSTNTKYAPIYRDDTRREDW